MNLLKLKLKNKKYNLLNIIYNELNNNMYNDNVNYMLTLNKIANVIKKNNKNYNWQK